MKKISVPACLVLIILGVFISACGGVVEKGLKPSNDWSKGIPVAVSVGGAVGVLMEDSGIATYLVWPEHTIERTNLHFVQLDQSGAEVAHQSHELLTGRQRSPRIAFAGEDRLHLLWIRRPPRENYWELWHMLLDVEGNIVREPALITSDDADVSSYDLVSGVDGTAYLVCEFESPGGIFGIEIDASGVPGELVALTQAGFSPSLRQDRRGDLHLAWFEGTQIQYANFSSFPQDGLRAESITTLPFGTGTTLLGPYVGLSDGWVYLFWSTLNRSGLEAGKARTEYMAFPKGNPGAVTTAERILVIPAEEQPYRGYAGEYSLTGLVEMTAVGFNSDYVYEPFAALGESRELGVALVTNQNYRQDVLVQPAVVIFEEGRLKGYSIAGKTLSFSRDPVLNVDAEGNLYLVWQEGSGGDQVFYATTAPETRANLDRFTGGDLINMLLRGGLEGFATSLLFPLALPWLVPGFLMVGVWKIYRDQETVKLVASKIILVISLLVYQVTKVLFIPDILTYVPFSAWVDIPSGWNLLLRIGVPTFIFLIGIGVAERIRRNSESTLVYYAAVSITDMILSMGVYGVFYLGVF